MNERRIVLNTLATYGRSVLSAGLGLFTARWVLGALGSSDFGLYGVVGGAVFVFSFLTVSLCLPEGRLRHSLGRLGVGRVRNSGVGEQNCVCETVEG